MLRGDVRSARAARPAPHWTVWAARPHRPTLPRRPRGTLLSGNGDLSAILTDLVVLGSFAGALLTRAALTLRHRLTTTPGA